MISNKGKDSSRTALARFPRVAGTMVLASTMLAPTGCVVLQELIKPVVATDGGQSTAASQQVSKAVQFNMTTQRDVDTTYTRLKRTFGFRTLDEIAPPGDKRREWKVHDGGYHHRVTPGVQYSMRERREIDGQTGIIQIDIDHDGEGSYLEVEYYVGGEYDYPPGDEFQQLVQTKIVDALN